MGYKFTKTGGGASSDSFSTIAVDNGTDPEASSATDTLTVTSSDGNITITGDSSTDTVDFTLPTEIDIAGASKLRLGAATGNFDSYYGAGSKIVLGKEDATNVQTLIFRSSNAESYLWQNGATGLILGTNENVAARPIEFWPNGTPSIKLNTDGTAESNQNLTIKGANSLKLNDSDNSAAVSIKANSTTTSHTLTLPATQGDAQTVIVNDGSGNLSWTDWPDPSKCLYGYWDFDGYAQNLASTDVGWSNVAFGSGATCVVNGGFSLDSTHPGNVRFQTGTTTTGFTGIFRGQCYTMGQGEFIYEALVYLANLSDGTDTYVFMLGTGSDFSATTDFTSGIYFRYTHGSSSGNWELKTAAAGSRTTRDTGIAAAAGAWTKLKYVVNAAGTSVQAYVNGSAAGAAITTNIPTANSSGLNVHLEKTAGTTNRITYLDYVKMKLTFTTAR